MIIKHLLILIFLMILSKISSMNALDYVKKSKDFFNYSNDHVNRIHHNLSSFSNETTSSSIDSHSIKFKYSNSIQSTNTKTKFQQNSSKSIHCSFINCTCLSLEFYNRNHNDSELNLINHCLHLNLTLQNGYKFILYDQFHPYQLHQLIELNLNHNNLTSLNENLILNSGHNQTIEILSLSHNQLNKFPILKDQSLKQLNLDHNQITLLSINRTNQSTKFEKLIELNLNQNQIRLIKKNFMISLCDQLEYIDLSSNRLRKLDSQLFINCKQLKILKLNRNKLNRIAFDCFDNLINLNQLDLSQNNLTNLKINFESMINLKILNLSKNRIKSIESTFEYLINLQTLNLNENNLMNLNENLVKGLKNLKLLQLSNNHIKQLDINWFDCRNSLINLYLEHNQINSIEEQTFKGLINLQKLYLDYNQISSIDLNAFRSNINLKWLFMNDNNLTNLIEKNRTLFIHNKLQYLALENNHLNYIPNQLFANLTSLITIDLNLNPLKFIEYNALECLTKLDELNFDSIDLECDCKMKWFVNYYQERSIENIYLEQLGCKTPKNLANKSFIDVDINYFLCEDDFKPYFLKEPRKQTLTIGQQFELKCKVVINSFIDEDIIFEWRKNNQTIALDNQINIVEIMKLSKDAKLNNKLIYSSHLKFLNTSINDCDDYKCIATNTYGSIESRTAKITCSSPPLSPILSVDTVQKNSIIINWIQDGNKNEITHYILYYKDNKTNWLWTTFAAKDQNTYTLNGLNESSLYLIYMKAISHHGLSGPSNILRQFTQSSNKDTISILESIQDSLSKYIQYTNLSTHFRSYLIVYVLIAIILLIMICYLATGCLKCKKKKSNSDKMTSNSTKNFQFINSSLNSQKINIQANQLFNALLNQSKAIQSINNLDDYHSIENLNLNKTNKLLIVRPPIVHQNLWMQSPIIEESENCSLVDESINSYATLKYDENDCNSTLFKARKSIVTFVDKPTNN